MAENALLKRLKEYKEFIAILVAAAGAFFWFDSLVAKKRDLRASEERIAELARQESVVRIECLLKSYMTLSQRQIRLAELNTDLSHHERLLGFTLLETKLEADPQLRQTSMNQTVLAEDNIRSIRGQILAEDGEIRRIRDALARHECGA